MFEKERIVQLRAQGYCTAAISVRLDLPTEYVRKVVAQVASRQAVRRARWEASPEGRNAAIAARRAEAKKKRAEALRLIAEANAELS